MRIRSKLFIAPILILFLICISTLIYRVYFWSPEAKWDESQNKVFIWSDPGAMHIDIGYIPSVQVWGDGHIIWVVHNTEGKRTVWEGYIPHNEMVQLINKLISLGFFRFGFEKYSVGEFLTVELTSDSGTKEVGNNQTFSEVYSFLKTGAGVTGKEFTPTTGLLRATPIKDTDLPSATEVKYYWPDDKFGYNLEKIHLNDGENITGEELQFAWEVVNSKIPVIKSNGKVYWITIELPGISR
jgi:hypothetical protein